VDADASEAVAELRALKPPGSWFISQRTGELTAICDLQSASKEALVKPQFLFGNGLFGVNYFWPPVHKLKGQI
jgi:hypothetical protein